MPDWSIAVLPIVVVALGAGLQYFSRRALAKDLLVYAPDPERRWTQSLQL